MKLLSHHHLKPYGLLVLACCLVYLPFLDKGIANDDLIFLDYAERLTLNPVRCDVRDYVFQGKVFEEFVVFESTHPPFIPYWLKLCQALFGENLALLHLGFLPFLILASLGLGSLIQRFTGFSPLLGLSITLGPLFLPNATSFMTDVPLFAFWVSALACWEIAFEERNKKNYWWFLLAGVFTFGAIFTAYQGLGILFLFAYISLVRKRWDGFAMVLGIALLPFLVWLFLIWKNYGLFPYFNNPREALSITTEVTKGLDPTNIGIKAKVLFVYLGSGLLFLTPLFLLDQKRNFWAILAVIAWTLVLGTELFGTSGNPQWWQGHLFLMVGLLLVPTLIHAFKKMSKHKLGRIHVLILSLWILGFALFQIVIAPFASPRYILLLLPPLLLLLLRSIEEQGRLFLNAAAGLMVILGLGVSWADMAYANAQDLQRLNLETSKNLWFVGEMGMKYSGEKLGYHYYRPGFEQDVGHLLIPKIVDRIAVEKNLMARAEKIETLTVESRLPIRVMAPAQFTSFYLHARGALPFSFGSGPLEEYTLYRCYRNVIPVSDAKPRFTTAGDVLPDQPVSQAFYCDRDGLSRIKIKFATHARVNHSTLKVTLYEVQGEEELDVFNVSFNASMIVDNKWYTIDFERLSSKNKNYRLELTSPDATLATGVTIWADLNGKSSFRRGEKETKGSLELQVLCAP